MSFYKRKNFYTVNSIEPGDVYLVTLKVMIDATGQARLYRCEYPGVLAEPQGNSIPFEFAEGVLRGLMPTICNWLFAPGGNE